MLKTHIEMWEAQNNDSSPHDLYVRTLIGGLTEAVAAFKGHAGNLHCACLFTILHHAFSRENNFDNNIALRTSGSASCQFTKNRQIARAMVIFFGSGFKHLTN